MFRLRSVRTVLVCFALFGAAVEPVGARTYDFRPHPAHVLGASALVVARVGPTGVGVYHLHTGRAVHQFDFPDAVHTTCCTPDESRLVVALAKECSVWNVRTGERLWRRSAREVGLWNVVGVNVSDSRAVLWDYQGRIVIVSLEAGAIVSRPAPEPGDGKPRVVLLSPDGSTVFGPFTSQGTLARFDPTGRRYVELDNVQDAAYSSDGRFVLCEVRQPDSRSTLAALDPVALTVRPFDGTFDTITQLRAGRAGEFYLTTCTDGDERRLVGLRANAATRTTEELWALPLTRDAALMDYDPELMLGVSTDFRYVTCVTDLRTGTVRVTIDNSAHYVPRVTSDSFSGGTPDFVPGIPYAVPVCAGGVLLSALVGVSLHRAGRSSRRPT